MVGIIDTRSLAGEVSHYIRFTLPSIYSLVAMARSLTLATTMRSLKKPSQTFDARSKRVAQFFPEHKGKNLLKRHDEFSEDREIAGTIFRANTIVEISAFGLPETKIATITLADGACEVASGWLYLGTCRHPRG